MKSKINSAIMLMLLLVLFSSGSIANTPNQNTVIVRNLESLVSAINPNTKIIIEMDELKLDANSVNYLPGHNYLHLEPIGDWTNDKIITIQNVDNLSIVGKPKHLSKTKIISPLSYGMVLKFKNVTNLKIANLDLGHDADVCSAGVLGFYDSNNIMVHNTYLFGSGTFGLELMNVSDFTFENSMIHDCSQYAISINNSKNLSFKSSKIKDIINSGFGEDKGSIIITNSNNITFDNMTFSNQSGQEHLFFLDDKSDATVQNSEFSNNKINYFATNRNAITQTGNNFDNDDSFILQFEYEATDGTAGYWYEPNYSSEFQVNSYKYGSKIPTSNSISNIDLSSSPLPKPNKKYDLESYFTMLGKHNIKAAFKTDRIKHHETQILKIYSCETSKSIFSLIKDLYNLPALYSFPEYRGGEFHVQEYPSQYKTVSNQRLTTRFNHDKKIVNFTYNISFEGGYRDVKIDKIAKCEWSIEDYSIAD